MEDNWDFYFSFEGDQMLSTMVNLALVDQAPNPDLPTVVRLRLVMRKPREDGLSSQEEFDKLDEIDELITTSTTKFGMMYVGRVTGKGVRDFLYYTDDADALERQLRRQMEDFPKYQFELTSRRDAEWKAYLDVLYPSDREMQSMQNRRVLQGLEEAGDDPTIEREVVHWIFFADAVGRGKFATRAKAQGFREYDRRDDGDGERKFMIAMAKTHTADPPTIDAAVLELFDLAAELGGRYDGWETKVERGD